MAKQVNSNQRVVDYVEILLSENVKAKAYHRTGLIEQVGSFGTLAKMSKGELVFEIMSDN